MEKLNLPFFDFNIKNDKNGSMIYDIIRKKYIKLTPEEWVRQHFIHFLNKNYHYPLGLMQIEGGLIFNQLQKRSDLMVIDRNGNPFLLLECKAPHVKLNQQVLEQVSTYNQKYKAPYIAISNGINHFICSIDFENGTYNYMNDFPVFK